MKDAPTSCSASLTPGGEQVCAWWARDAWHLAPVAPCQMLTVAGDPVLLGPACANAREFRLTSTIAKGLVCSTPGCFCLRRCWGELMRLAFLSEDPEMQQREHDELDLGHQGSWLGSRCPVSQGAEAPEKEICPGTPRSKPRPVQYPPDTAGTSPTELGVVEVVVP